MSRGELIVIDTEDPFENIVATVAQLLGATLVENYGDEAILVRGDTRIALEDPADLEDDVGMPLSEFRYLADVRTNYARCDGYVRQEAVAREIYDALVAGTSWRLLLAFNDAMREIARRDAT